jgi:hypothetical protein
MGFPFAHVAARTRKARIEGLVKTKIVTQRCVQKGILKLGLAGSDHRLFDSQSIDLGRSDRAQKYPVLPRSGLVNETIMVLNALFSQRDIRERQFESGPSSRRRSQQVTDSTSSFKLIKCFNAAATILGALKLAVSKIRRPRR